VNTIIRLPGLAALCPSVRVQSRALFFAFGLLLVLVFPVTTLTAAAATAPDPTDLGHGLKYFRPAAAAEITPAAVAPAALVLDLRGVSTADASVSAAILAALRARPAVGRAAGDCRPEIAVSTDVTAEQRALVALATGTPPTALLGTPVAGKPRHDEAELAKDHAAGRKPGDLPGDHAPSPAAPAVEPKAPATAPVPAAPPPLVDAVLQRAAQLHRGLLALGRI
jgi:hypothetical protein